MSSIPLPEPVLPGVRWGVAIRDADTGDLLVSHHETRVLRTASIGKLFTLLATAEHLERGVLTVDQELVPSQGDYVEDSGLLYRLRFSRFPVQALAILTGAVSDNYAANMLLRACGLTDVQSVSRRLGYTDTMLLDWVRTERTPDMPPTLSRGNARDLSDLMVRLRQGTALSPEISARVNNWIAGGTDLSMVAGAFDLDPLAHIEPDGGILLRNKTGTIDTARADVGWVRSEITGRSLAYAVLANWDEDAPADTRHRVLHTMHSIGRRISDELERSRTL